MYTNLPPLNFFLKQPKEKRGKGEKQQPYDPPYSLSQLKLENLASFEPDTSTMRELFFIVSALSSFGVL